ncbi:MAG: cysteine hydrolase [Deltaproteobacteria bacterium]|nr:cysteine hydrolase [Deltaproteobacteria bacterium]
MKNCALLLIDVQKGFRDPSWGKRNNPKAEDNMKLLLEAFRSKRLPIIHIQHLSCEKDSPLRPGQEGIEFMEGFEPMAGEKVFQKSVNSAFIGTDLESCLRKEALQNLVIVGLTTDHCISTTVRMASNLGFTVYLVADATATFERKSLSLCYSPELVHEVNLASLHREFATVTTAENILMNR